MVIGMVDTALTAFLRAALPLPESVGDVSFEVPDAAWSAQLNRVTVNLHLWDVVRSDQPSRPAQQRTGSNGQLERRGPLPLVRLSYMATAWAGSVADEHQLLSELLGVLLGHQVLPAEHVPADFPGSVQVALAQRAGRRPGDLWTGGLDGRMKPVLELDVTLPVAAGPWLGAAPAVERIAALVAPRAR